MTDAPQRWLSITGICTSLNITRKHALWLARNGFLEVLWGPNKNNRVTEARFLDPTPAYAKKLLLGESLYGRLFPVPTDLDICGLLTLREVAQVVGWSIKYARKYVYKYKVPAVRAGHYDLYSMQTVRDIMWRRSGRRQSKQRAPFLVEEIVSFFLKMKAQAEEEVPTDAEFAKDDLLQRKLVRMTKMKSPEREQAMKDFMGKVALAKALVRGAA